MSKFVISENLSGHWSCPIQLSNPPTNISFVYILYDSPSPQQPPSIKPWEENDQNWSEKKEKNVVALLDSFSFFFCLALERRVFFFTRASSLPSPFFSIIFRLKRQKFFDKTVQNLPSILVRFEEFSGLFQPKYKKTYDSLPAFFSSYTVLRK